MLAERLLAASLATAVQLMERQHGVLAPFAHTIDAAGRLIFLGRYESDLALRTDRALAALIAQLRAQRLQGAAVVFAGRDGASGRAMLSIEIETLDSAPEAIFVPYLVGYPRFRRPVITTYAPERFPGTTRILT